MHPPSDRATSTLTRDALNTGEFLTSLGLAPQDLWTQAQLEESLAAILRARPPGPLWVFAYGSLMWNPLLEVEDRQVATLDGWHRSFCLRTTAGRGSVETPGRMLALEPGGVTRGVALRLRDSVLADELRLLWTREMATGSYRPVWTTIALRKGEAASAIAFVADPQRPQYESDASVETIAPVIAAARGTFGSNADYVHNLDFALADSALEDEYICRLVSRLKEYSGRSRSEQPCKATHRVAR